MGLILEISLDKDIKEIDAFFDDLKFKAITLAARQGLNRAATSIRSLANKEFRKRRNMKLQDVNKRIFIRKAKGSNLAQLEAKIIFSGVPLPLILFITEQKTPLKQTLPNPQRKARVFQVRKGRRIKRKGLFVQKAKRGKARFQVFRRKDPSNVSKGFKVQRLPSLAAFFRAKTSLFSKIENNALNILQTKYNAALKFQLQKLKL